MATANTAKGPRTRLKERPASSNGAEPKISELGRKLMEIRAQAIAEGLKLCTVEEIEREMDQMRGRTNDRG